MPDIVATVSDPAGNSYLSLADADAAMDSFPNAKAWEDFDEATRQRILIEATRKIDRYKSWGPKQVATQSLAFPTNREQPGIIPQEVTNAFLEFLDFKADGGLESLKRLQAEGVTNRSLLGQSSTFKADDSLLPSGCRRELDKLWQSHKAPRMVETQHTTMFTDGLSADSVFQGDPQADRVDNGPLSSI